MIYITGDTHGKREIFSSFLNEDKWSEGDHLIICGDFGFVFICDEEENVFLDELEKKPYTICFCDGNHENFKALSRYKREMWNGGMIHRIRKNVIHLMRGQVFEIEGKTFFTMGGAFSRDRETRILGLSYWEEELPCESEYREATASLRYKSYKVDYIITHNGPASVIRSMGKYPRREDGELTAFLDDVAEKTEFRHWFFGHWHMNKTVKDKYSCIYKKVIAIGE